MSYGFYIKEGKPYYTDGTKSYPCSIAADKTTVKFDSGTALVQSDVKSLLTEAEVKHNLGVKFVMDWDAAKKKQVKVSNQTVSSIVETPE